MSTAIYPARLHYDPISEEIAREARETLVDRFGHRLRVVREIAPCRLCLRIPTEPEKLILLSYQPSPDTGPYAEIGPIFIHADRCERYSAQEQFPNDFASRQLILRAYGYDGSIVAATIADREMAPARAAELFQGDTVAEIHVRHTSYTCFDFKITRAHERH